RDCLIEPLRRLHTVRGRNGARGWGRVRVPSRGRAGGRDGSRGRRCGGPARTAGHSEGEAGTEPEPTLNGDGHRESQEGFEAIYGRAGGCGFDWGCRVARTRGP